MMNPYDSQPTAHLPLDSEPKTIVYTGRFRWLVIPASLSWFFGGLMLVGIPIGMLQNADMLDRHGPKFFATLLLGFVLLFAGIFNLIAGSLWLRGRWVLGIVFNGLAYGTLQLIQAIASTT